MTVILSPSILFGVPDPLFAIEGYLLIARKKEFVKARSLGPGREEYFIRDAGKSWELWRCHYDGQKTPRNPRGERVGDEPRIVISKSKP